MLPRKPQKNWELKNSNQRQNYSKQLKRQKNCFDPKCTWDGQNREKRSEIILILGKETEEIYKENKKIKKLYYIFWVVFFLVVFFVLYFSCCISVLCFSVLSFHVLYWKHFTLCDILFCYIFGRFLVRF